MQSIKVYLPGFIFCTIILIFSYLIETYLKSQDILISIAFISLVIGMLFNKVYLKHKKLHKFTEFSLKNLLRIGIAFLGISLSITQLLSFGYMSLFLIIINIIIVFFVLYVLSKYFNISKNLSYLIGMGTAICGVTAVIATSSILKPKQNEVSYAVTIVTLFGLITVIVYPYISHYFFEYNNILAGIFLGASIHDTAQVSAAGMIYNETFNSQNTLNSAMTTKLLRNSFLIILIPILTLKLMKSEKINYKSNIIKFLPLFVFGFVFFSCIRSLGDIFLLKSNYEYFWLGSIFYIKAISKVLIIYGMLSLGLQTNLRAIYDLGYKPLILGFIACTIVGINTIVYLKNIL